MTLKDIVQYRLFNQYIANHQLSTPQEVVYSLGAIQAQDYLGSLWAIGLRLKNASEATIEQEILAKKIVRTWPMRGTLHFVAAEDVRWMLKLLTPRVIERTAGIYRQSELTESIFNRSKEILIKSLEGGKSLTRENIYSQLKQSGIAVEQQRGLHIIGWLAQNGIICFGERDGKQQTFALLDEWLPPYQLLEGDEALAELARRYFKAHGPATLKDFIWWAGLKASEAKVALELIKSELCHTTVNGENFWFSCELPETKKPRKNIYLLPPYDEFLIGYTDRSASLSSIHSSKVLSKNGIFYPVIVKDGNVIGTWKRTFRREKVNIQIDAFNSFSTSDYRGIDVEAKRYSRFVNQSLSVTTES